MFSFALPAHTKARVGGILRAAEGIFQGDLNKVSERRDDVQAPEPESRPRPKPGSYYYDDATGYETYSPEEDEEETDAPPAPEGG